MSTSSVPATSAPATSETPPIESRILAFIAWFFSILGAILILLILLVTKREDRFAKFWIAQSIGALIVDIVGFIIASILALIPIIGWIASIIILLALFVIWLIGIYYTITGQFKRPPIVEIVSKRIEPILLA